MPTPTAFHESALARRIARRGTLPPWLLTCTLLALCLGVGSIASHLALAQSNPAHPVFECKLSSLRAQRHFHGQRQAGVVRGRMDGAERILTTNQRDMVRLRGDRCDLGESQRRLQIIRVDRLANGNTVVVALSEAWVDGQWVNAGRTTDTYDATDALIQALRESWSVGQWVNEDRDTYTRDASGRSIEWLVEIWEEGQWVNNRRYSYTYENDFLVQADLDVWENDQWVPSGRTTYTFESGRTAQAVGEEWENERWVLSGRVTYSYDAEGRWAGTLYEYWENEQWVNSGRVTYSYHGENVVETLIENWEDNGWIPDTREAYSYEADLLVQLILSSWDSNGSEWIDLLRITYTHHAGLVIQAFSEAWILDHWVNNTRETYTYEDGEVSVWLLEVWEDEQWVNDSRVTVTRSGMVGTAIEDKHSVAYRLDPAYPNPFNPATTLGYTLPSSEHVTLYVYDALGRRVATLVDEQQGSGQHYVRFNASGLSSGVYLYQLRVGTYAETRHALLVK